RIDRDKRSLVRSDRRRNVIECNARFRKDAAELLCVFRDRRQALNEFRFALESHLSRIQQRLPDLFFERADATVPKERYAELRVDDRRYIARSAASHDADGDCVFACECRCRIVTRGTTRRPVGWKTLVEEKRLAQRNLIFGYFLRSDSRAD